MKGINRFFDNLRKRSLQRGYACDHCGRELFDYPAHRLCERCEGKLHRSERTCEKCGRERIAEGICLDCKVKPPAFTAGVSPFTYKGAAALLVNRFKNGTPRLCAYFGEKMGEKFIERFGGEWSETLLLIPLPLTREKLRERGYNQSQRLAESVEGHLLAKGIAVETDMEVLIKVRETKPQKRMSRKEREENVQGAYHVHKRKACQGRTILLIDDVLTTGATGSACAKLLLGAGAKAVYLLTAVAVGEEK